MPAVLAFPPSIRATDRSVSPAAASPARTRAQRCALVAIVCLHGAPGAARAEIYKCVDLDGHVSYGSAPCAESDLLDRLIQDNGIGDAAPPAATTPPEQRGAPGRYVPPSPDRGRRGRSADR